MARRPAGFVVADGSKLGKTALWRFGRLAIGLP